MPVRSGPRSNPAPLELREGRSFPGEPRMGHLDVFKPLTALPVRPCTEPHGNPSTVLVRGVGRLGLGASGRDPLSCGPPVLAADVTAGNGTPTGGSWTSPGPPSLFPDASTACRWPRQRGHPYRSMGYCGLVRSAVTQAFSGPRTTCRCAWRSVGRRADTSLNRGWPCPHRAGHQLAITATHCSSTKPPEKKRFFFIEPASISAFRANGKASSAMGNVKPVPTHHLLYELAAAADQVMSASTSVAPQRRSSGQKMLGDCGSNQSAVTH